jgi:uncharacterized phage protein (TIGR02218 family)
MSYDAQEQSQYGSQPYELFLFSTSGQNFYLTSADQTITYLGNTYQPTTIQRSEFEHTNEVVSGQIKVRIPKNHPLAALFIPYLPPTPMALTIFGSHYSDSETVVIFSGKVASARFTDECELTVNSDLYILQRQIPIQLYQAACPHVFGDAGCKFPLGTVTYTGTIATVNSTGDVITAAAFSGTAFSLRGGYFQRGNDVRMIVDHTGNQITLMSGISGLNVGDACTAVAGCMHTYSDCNARNNVANFLGFDLIPQTNPFDSSKGVE